MTLIFMCEFDIGLRVHSLNYCLGFQIENYWISLWSAVCPSSGLQSAQEKTLQNVLIFVTVVCPSLINSREDFLLFPSFSSSSFFSPSLRESRRLSQEFFKSPSERLLPTSAGAFLPSSFCRLLSAVSVLPSAGLVQVGEGRCGTRCAGVWGALCSCQMIFLNKY